MRQLLLFGLVICWYDCLFPGQGFVFMIVSEIPRQNGLRLLKKYL